MAEKILIFHTVLNCKQTADSYLADMCSSIDSSLMWSFKDFIGVVFFGVLSKLFILRLWSGDSINNDFEAMEVKLEPLAGVLLEGLAWSF